MYYFPVGARASYTAKIDAALVNSFRGYTTLENFITNLKMALAGLDGEEQFIVETSNGQPSFAGTSTFQITFLNNGVDHGDENDARSIIDGIIQGGPNGGNPVTVLSSDIFNVKQPGDPNPQSTGAASNVPVGTFRTTITGAPAPDPGTGSNWFDSLFAGAGLSASSKIITALVVVVVAIVALSLLLPGGFVKIARAARR